MKIHQVMRMIKKGFGAAVAVLFMFGFVAFPAQAALPEHFDFGDNYYTVFGGPDISATLLGDNEFSRGDTVTLNIEMMNKGMISGFRSEKDLDFEDEVVDRALQQAEMQYEAQAVTAIGILATLRSEDPNIKVKSGPQEAGTLKQGKEAASPSKFTIEISKNAPAGTYPLTLELSYAHQANVQVSGDDFNKDIGGIINHEVGLWYENKTQTQTIEVQVKREPYFEASEVKGELYPEVGGMLYVTYKNIGEEPAKDATVRVSAGDPFSTTDDQAYLGSLNPGESAVAAFDMDVDEEATPKPYSLNSEILYEDMDGHDQISDSIKINTEILPAEKKLPGYSAVAGVSFMALAACLTFWRNKRKL